MTRIQYERMIRVIALSSLQYHLPFAVMFIINMPVALFNMQIEINLHKNIAKEITNSRSYIYILETVTFKILMQTRFGTIYVTIRRQN